MPRDPQRDLLLKGWAMGLAIAVAGLVIALPIVLFTSAGPEWFLLGPAAGALVALACMGRD